MVAIKKYFLCVLMFNSFSLFTMDMTNTYLEEIDNMINHVHLGISKYNYFKSIFGPIMSYYQTTFLLKEEAIKKIEAIESYIPTDGYYYSKQNRKELFEKLVAKHWYVNYLMQTLVDYKIEEFKNVSGSTIDELNKPNFHSDYNGVKEIIHNEAYKSFIDASGIEKTMPDIPFKVYDDIHITVLYGHDNTINPNSLIMSSDGKYLQSKDLADTAIIWDMKKGLKVDPSNEQRKTINWSSSRHTPHYMHNATIDATDNFLALSSASSGKIWHIDIDPDKPAILLFQRPQKLSYLCQRAFKNNRNNYDNLLVLKNSASFKAIKGFPKNNLQQLIDYKSIASHQPQGITPSQFSHITFMICGARGDLDNRNLISLHNS